MLLGKLSTKTNVTLFLMLSNYQEKLKEKVKINKIICQI